MGCWPLTDYYARGTFMMTYMSWNVLGIINNISFGKENQVCKKKKWKKKFLNFQIKMGDKKNWQIDGRTTKRFDYALIGKERSTYIILSAKNMNIKDGGGLDFSKIKCIKKLLTKALDYWKVSFWHQKDGCAIQMIRKQKIFRRRYKI